MTTPLDNAISLLTRLIAFDTVSDKSNLGIIDFIADYLSGLGFACYRVESENSIKAGLIAAIGEGEGGIALSGHTDVVPVVNQEWDSDPFILSQRGSRLYGRGTCDMKGFIACVLSWCGQLNTLQLKHPVYLVFSYDEEIGCLSAAKMAGALKDYCFNPDYIIIGEPTQMQLATRHKGIRTFYTSVKGREAHSSNPANGVNANFVMARLITKLENLQQQVKAQTDNRFNPPYTTFNVGIAAGGEAGNIVPAHAEICWEIRSSPETEPAAVIKEFEDYCLQAAAEYGAEVHTRVRSSVPGLISDGGHVNRILRLLGSNQAVGVPFTSEAGIFNNAGIPAVVLGPGSIEQAHKPNEFVEINQLEQCLKFLNSLEGELI